MSQPVRPTVLVIDDDASALDIVSRLLDREGFRVLRATSGAEALACVAREAVDVVLLDVMMPEMDGLEVCGRLRADEHLRKLPVILLTAKDDVDTRASGMQLGVSEFLTKPINKHELLSRVHAQLHTRQLERDLDRLGRRLHHGRSGDLPPASE